METVPEKKSKLASASFWCAASLALSCLVVGAVFSNLENDRPFLLLFMIGTAGTFLMSIVSIVLGCGPLSAADKDAAKRRIRFGIIGLILIPVAGVLIPNRYHNVTAANEASAVGSLRTVHIATDTYAKAHSEDGFPASLGDLSDLVDPNLASGVKSGYRFTYTPRSTHNNGKLDAYDVIAEPVVPQTTGNRYFFSDETGVVSFSLSRDPAGKKPL